MEGGDVMSINVGNCPRCGKFVIAEQLEHHDCRISFTDVENITIDHYYEMISKDEEGHTRLIAVGLDGTLYKMTICTHNPPHGATKRKFTGYGTKQGLDSTLAAG
jgi:hypothetical protein